MLRPDYFRSIVDKKASNSQRAIRAAFWAIGLLAVASVRIVVSDYTLNENWQLLGVFSYGSVIFTAYAAWQTTLAFRIAAKAAWLPGGAEDKAQLNNNEVRGKYSVEIGFSAALVLLNTILIITYFFTIGVAGK